MRAKLIAIVLSLCSLAGSARADHIQDVAEWPANCLPIVANWNTGGFPFEWHIDQVRQGNRLLPTTRLYIRSIDKTGTIQPAKSIRIEPDAEVFLRDNKLPFSMRVDNIALSIGALPRWPKVPDSIPKSALIWIEKDGKLDDLGNADYFGPPSVWAEAGALWAKTGMLREMQERFPDAPCIVIADNHETGYDKPAQYLTSTGWKTPTALAALNLRVRDFAAKQSVDDFHRARLANTDAQYRAMFDAFDAGLTHWQGKIRWECYETNTLTNSRGDRKYHAQYVGDYGHFDGGGSPLYISDAYLGDFTSPKWFNVFFASPVALKAEESNPRHFREVFLQFRSSAAYYGWQLGRHEIITPERAQAATEFILWSIHGQRKPVMLRYWLPNGEKDLSDDGSTKKILTLPTSLFLDTDAARKAVTDAGFPELTSATEMDYLRPVIQAVNSVCENPTLRKFWIEGKPVQTGSHPGNEIRAKPKDAPIVFPEPGDQDEGFRLLECDANPPRSAWVIPPGPNSRGDYRPQLQIKVWAIATELGGDYLLFIWSPCKLPLTCAITLPNGWRVPVTLTSPKEYRRLRPQQGFEVETIQ